MSTASRMLTPWRRLLGAYAISNVGDGIYAVAFPLLGATLTNDPRWIAALGAAVMLPNLVLALPAGVIVDRLDRGKLMVVVDTLRVVLLGLLVWLVWAGTLTLWQLFLIAIILGAAELLFDIAASAFLPSIVPVRELPRANGLLSTVAELGNGVIGPAVGGLLFAASFALPFAVDAVGFAIAVILLLRFATKKRDAVAQASEEAPEEATGTGFWREAAYGVGWLWRHRELRSIAVVIGAWNFFGWMPEAILVLYVAEEMGLGSLGFGILFATTSVGAIIGGLISGRLVDKLGPGAVLTVTTLTYGVLMLPPAFITSPWLVGAVFLLQGIPLIAWSSMSESIRQAMVPDELRGRVGSVFRLMGAGMAPIGFIVGGFIADWFDLRSVFIVGGVGLIGAFVLNMGSLRKLSARFADRMAEESVAETTEPDDDHGDKQSMEASRP